MFELVILIVAAILSWFLVRWAEMEWPMFLFLTFVISIVLLILVT